MSKRTILPLFFCFTLMFISCVSESTNGELKGTPKQGTSIQIYPDVASVVEAVAPSVVLVRTRKSVTDRYGRINEGTSNGSGIIFDEQGHILTNNNVVEGATSVDVVLRSGQEVQSEVIGTDPNTDLAVLKINTEDVQNLVVTSLADSSNTRIGEWVIAIGNPLGYEGSVTVGVLSARDRSLKLPDARLHDLLQTDAVINPGNSGGPLLNLRGEVIGINTAVIRGTLASGKQAEGIGLAVASTTAIPVSEQIIQHGKVLWPRIGVGIDDVTPANAEKLGLSVDRGVLVLSLAKDGPAEHAGIEPNDVIVALGGESITKFTEMRRLMLNKYSIGDSLTVKVIRGTDKLDFVVVLDELVFD